MQCTRHAIAFENAQIIANYKSLLGICLWFMRPCGRMPCKAFGFARCQIADMEIYPDYFFGVL